MGNQFSADKNCVVVRCEKDAYYAGETVRGLVCLNLVDEIEATKIELLVLGMEQAKYDSNQLAIVTGTQPGTQRDTRNEFFRREVPLAQNIKLAPGQYQYSFVFVLPEELPSSLDYKDGKNPLICPRARVCYKVKARVDVPGLLGWDVKNTQYLRVLQKEGGAKPKAVHEEVESTIKRMGLMSLGKATVTLDAAADRLVAGEDVEVTVSANNQADCDMDLKVSLLQQVVMDADWAPEKKTEREVAVEELGEVKSKSTVDARTIKIKVPITAQPSIKGKTVTCTHSLEAVLSGGLSASDAKARVPVTVVPPPPSAPALTAVPPEWKPDQKFNAVLVELPGAPPLSPEEKKAIFWDVVGTVVISAAVSAGGAFM